jgi:hypothetical protein
MHLSSVQKTLVQYTDILLAHRVAVTLKGWHIDASFTVAVCEYGIRM